jgi:eukaryotic-like serine/threonine-protein kinase
VAPPTLPCLVLIAAATSLTIGDEMSFRSKVRSLFRFIFLLTILGTVALISFVAAIRFTVHGPQEKLANLTGRPVEEAERSLEAGGLKLKVEDHLYSSTVALDGIISQMPAPGTPVRSGQHVHVLVSLGPPTIEVPDLLGTNFRAARVSAIQQGLTMGDIASLYWPGSERDEVIGQEPPASAKDVRSPAVDFLVSLGDPEPAYVCPSFIGKTVAVAKRELAVAGFKNVQLTSILSPGSAAGTVIKQVPLPGTRITPDIVFNLQVAK